MVMNRRAKKPEPRTHYRVNVLGPPGAGKSSLIKRLVCHRFDNLPTRNDAFMGIKADGRCAAAQMGDPMRARA